jgi:hypothetical protein
LLDIIGMVAAFTLIETSLNGKLVSHGRGSLRSSWPVPLWPRPIFAMVGFVLFAFAVVDFFKKLSA